MNKIIAYAGILAIISLVSCGPQLNRRLTDNHYIINPTGKRMIHELSFSVPLEYNIDSTLRHYSNGANIREEFEWKVSYAVGPMTASQAEIGYQAPFYLYNVDDTTVLLWEKYWRQYDDSLKVFCPFYWTSEGSIEDDKEYNRITNRYLMISDSLLSLMRKDYTMLDKFSEYYDR